MSDTPLMDALYGELPPRQPKSEPPVRSSDLLGVPWCSECGSRTIGRHGMGCRVSYERDRELRDSVYGKNICKLCYGRRIIEKLHRRDDGVIERIHQLRRRLTT